MHVSCVVPARIGSTRFPAKPLAKISGREMILHTLDRAKEANSFKRIICATDSQEIADLVIENGYEAIITPSDCITGSDRVYYAAQQLDLDLILNVQGDEPVIQPEVLQQMCNALLEGEDGWITAATNLEPEFEDRASVVKVAVDENGYALDFFRDINPKYSKLYKHKGIYGYSLKTLKSFSTSEQSESEKLLSLEQLRVFPSTKIKVVLVDQESHSVDIPQDIAIVEEIFERMQVDQLV